MAILDPFRDFLGFVKPYASVASAKAHSCIVMFTKGAPSMFRGVTRDHYFGDTEICWIVGGFITVCPISKKNSPTERDKVKEMNLQKWCDESCYIYPTKLPSTHYYA